MNLEAAVEVLQKQNEEAKAELNDTDQKLLSSQTELTSSQAQVEELERNLDETTKHLQGQKEGMQQELAEKDQELLSTRTNLFVTQTDLANMREKSRAVSAELYRTKSALLQFQTLYQSINYVALHLSLSSILYLHPTVLTLIFCLMGILGMNNSNYF